MLPPREFLKKVKPFDLLDEDELEFLVANIDVEAFEEGEVIFRGKPKKVYVVLSGTVGIYRNGELVDEFQKGDIFGLGLITADVEAVAHGDVVCYTVDKKVFERLLELNKRFADFFKKFAGREFQEFVSLARGVEIEEKFLVKRISELITKKPVVCDPYTKIRDAVVKMEMSGVGSIVIVRDDMSPLGIFTNRDLRKFVIHGESKNELISAYMSSPVVSVEHDTPLFEAQAVLMRHRINHLVVTRHGKVIGVVSAKDLLAQHEPLTSITVLHRRLAKAKTLEEVRSILSAMVEAVKRLAKRGAHFYELSALLADVYDLATENVLKIVESEFEAENGGLPPYVWVHMGSSARKEQVIATDQDNAIIHEGDGDLLEFAAKVNDALDYVGIPKCSGGYMASNPEWNASVEEWKEKFREWMTNFTPENIRHLTVFLDMRGIYGKLALLDEVFEAIEESVTKQVLRYLAYDATLNEPPKLTGIRKVEEVDIKKYGIYPIVNCTRVLALESRVVRTTNTRERLKRLTDIGIIDERTFRDLSESFGFLQELRFQNQVEGRGNIVNLREIGRVESFVLREVFRIVRDFEGFVKGHFNVERGI